MKRLFIIALVLLSIWRPVQTAEVRQPLNGYYITFMRMPVMDLEDWKLAIDGMATDGVQQVVLWMGGGFPSKKYPITWTYNQDHKNNRENYFPKLIEYAHQKKIRVLLGFTPFGYDGVNQYTLEHPELRARKINGQEVDAFGIHSWGWSLCPSKPESQRFMLEYLREMIFEYYPKADGLFIESSDYDICRCPDCLGKYYDREFPLVEQISHEVWRHNPEAAIFVYPHYFTGRKANAGTAIEAETAKKPFDARWQLVFTPHSAHLDSNLLQQGARGIFSNDAMSLGTPAAIKQGAATSKANGLGYVPSFEPFSYLLAREEFGAAHLQGKRLAPLGYEWLKEEEYGKPFEQLPARVQRLAFQLYTQNPDLSEQQFRQAVGNTFFRTESSERKIDDLLFLQECVNLDRSWTASSPLVNPEYYKLKAQREKWGEDRKINYRQRLKQLEMIAQTYSSSSVKNENEMHRIARFIVNRWRASGMP